MSAAGFLGGVVAIVRAVRAAVKEGKCTAAWMQLETRRKKMNRFVVK
jgi:hypothetical protein